MEPQTRRRFPFFATILVVLLGSYTFVRLRHAADSLPYDPGPPWPTVNVDGTQDGKVADRLALAFRDRRSVQLIGADDDASNRLIEAWPLRGLEHERALRYLATMRAAAEQVPRERRTRDDCLHLAQITAVTSLIEQDLTFVVNDLAPAQQGDRWHFWNTLLFEAGEHRRVLCAPIDKDEFSYVRRAETADPATFEPR